MDKYERHSFGVCMAAAAGGVLGALLLAAVVAAGNTFGQRCAKVYEHGSGEWIQCVERMARGEALQ